MILDRTARQNAETSAAGVAESRIDCFLGGAGELAELETAVLDVGVVRGFCVINWVEELFRAHSDASVHAERLNTSFILCHTA